MVSKTTILFTISLLTLTTATRFPDDTFFDPRFASMCVSTPRKVRKVFENHFKQLNACSLRGLKAERSAATQLFFGPNLIKGEAEVDEVFDNFCKSRADGGLNGLQFVEQEAFVVGNVISVKWIVSAPFLAEDYPGSDAYVTCGNKLMTIVSSFDGNELKFKDDM